MWYFRSPEIVFGEDALSRLQDLDGSRAFIVTDKNMVELGHVATVRQALGRSGIESSYFGEVEPDPALATIRRAAQAMEAYGPDWVVGLGGGSSLDAAKTAWFLYERPDLEPAMINPFDDFGLRSKARLITIATTSGTGAEITWAVSITDEAEQRKMGLAAVELMPDIAIVDPRFVRHLPANITADTGIDALTHAVESYVSSWANDFGDGLALHAIRLIFRYLPRAYADGSDMEARERMHNAAAIAGLAFSNGSLAVAHSLGHALGSLFHIPHGRAVGLFLPYSIEFTVPTGKTRYAEIAHMLELPAADEAQGAASLVTATRRLMRTVAIPTTVAELGISAEEYRAALPHLVANAEVDTMVVTGWRIADEDELEKLFLYAYDGRRVDF